MPLSTLRPPPWGQSYNKHFTPQFRLGQSYRVVLNLIQMFTGNVTRSGGQRAEGGGRRAEGRHWADDEGLWQTADGGRRTERSFYFVLVPPIFDCRIQSLKPGLANLFVKRQNTEIKFLKIPSLQFFQNLLF